jgi:holo-[acyl-carrier protein] synthase
MDIIGLGTDLIECARIRDVWSRHGDRFAERVLTPAERAYVQTYASDIVPRVAGRFAAKEAILKVLGTGWRGQIAWCDMEILNDSAGRPSVTLTGECRRVADQLGITCILISITHTENYASATAIGISETAP